MVIYKTTNLINGLVYVGKDAANNPRYLGSGRKLRIAIRQYGRDNFVKEVLQKCSSMKEMNEIEDYWIALFDARNPNKGYNVARGGQGGFLDHLPANFIERCRNGKAKMSFLEKREAVRKFKETIAAKSEQEKIDTFNKRSAAKRGQRPWNKGQKILNPRRGFSLSKEHRFKLRKPKTEQHKQNLRKPRPHVKAHNRRRLIQLNIRGELVKIWDSVRDACNALNLHSSNICKVAGSSKRTLGGFKWKYEDREKDNSAGQRKSN